MAIVNKLAFTAALLAATIATPASADLLLFSYVGTTDGRGPFSFNIDSSPMTLGFNEGGFVAAISNPTGQYDSLTTVDFYSSLDNGGILAYRGPQLFSGPTSSPSFLSGTFTLSQPSGNVDKFGVLTISAVNSAVPEPATWAMMLLGFGAMGVAMRRRRQTVLVRFQKA